MESLIENYLGGRHTLMYMNMTLGMYHPCKGVAREAGNDVVCYCSQHFENAPAEIQKIGTELLDLAQILELFESVLQPLRNGAAGEKRHVDFIERSLARIRNDVQKVADLLVSLQPKARIRNTKGRAKWACKKEDVASMMAVVERQKQTLLTQLNLLNL